ncbi:MAG: phage portal protein [Bacteroides sp.]|nr:phage portal protein [Bacteroides sp.]
MNRFRLTGGDRRGAASMEKDVEGNFWIYPALGAPGAALFGAGFRGFAGLAASLPEVFFPIDAIAERASSLPFRLMRDGLPLDEREAAGYGGVPQVLAKPNLQQDFSQFVYELLFYRLATGTTWVRSVRGVDGKARGLRVIDPDNAEPVFAYGMPAAWEDAVRYDEIMTGLRLPHNVLVDVSDLTVSVERPDPLQGGVRGTSPLAASAPVVEILKRVYQARYNVYAANGVAGILCKEGSDKGGLGADVDPRLRKEMADELSKSYNISGFSASVKALSTVPLKFIDTLAKIKDLEPWRESDRDALAIAALYQVPKHLVPNEVGVTFDNAKESEKAFWQNVVIPAAETAGRVVGEALGLPEGVALMPDVTAVPVLQEDRLGGLQADRQEIDNLQTISTAFPALADRAGALAEAIVSRYEQNGND